MPKLALSGGIQTQGVHGMGVLTTGLFGVSQACMRSTNGITASAD